MAVIKKCFGFSGKLFKYTIFLSCQVTSKRSAFKLKGFPFSYQGADKYTQQNC